MIIGIIGTESVGKTTLVKKIEEETDFSALYEYGREYTTGRVVENLTMYDYININKGHLGVFNGLRGDIVMDTETLTTISWCKLMLDLDLDLPLPDKCDKYFFLLNKKVNFVQDGTRVTENIRDKHEKILKELLIKYGVIDRVEFVSMEDFDTLDQRNDYILKIL